MKGLIPILLLALTSWGYSQTLDSILADYDRQKEVTLRPLEEKYDAELAKLLQKLTAAGNLKDSVEVNKLLKERIGQSAGAGSTTWVWPDDKKLTLAPDGTASFTAWPTPGTWKKLDDQNIEVTNPDGKIGTLKLLPDGKGSYISGANNKGGVPVTKQPTRN